MLQSIYTHAGCDHVQVSPPGSRRCFNPHTHAGCDFVIIPLIRQVCVSIHTPTQGVTGAYWLLMLNRSSFNPHTHAGCDFGVIQARQEAVVSIHTPTQGVTIVIFNGINISIVSIHTPTQGVTSHLSSVSSMECFNPHTHAGCDR